MPKVGVVVKPVEMVKPVSAAPMRPEKVAINLADLDRLDQFVREVGLGGKLCLDPLRLIDLDKNRADEKYVELTCDLLMAASMCDVLRSADRNHGDYPTRVVVFRRSWTKMVANCCLTLVQWDDVAKKSTVVLNPEFFTPLVCVVKEEKRAEGKVVSGGQRMRIK